MAAGRLDFLCRGGFLIGPMCHGILIGGSVAATRGLAGFLMRLLTWLARPPIGLGLVCRSNLMHGMWAVELLYSLMGCGIGADRFCLGLQGNG